MSRVYEYLYKSLSLSVLAYEEVNSLKSRLMQLTSQNSQSLNCKPLGKHPDHILLLAGPEGAKDILAGLEHIPQGTVKMLSIVIRDELLVDVLEGLFLLRATPSAYSIGSLYVDYQLFSAESNPSSSPKNGGPMHINLIHSSTNQNEIFLDRITLKENATLPDEPVFTPINLILSTQDFFSLSKCMAWNIGFAELVHLQDSPVAFGIQEALLRYASSKQNFGK